MQEHMISYIRPSIEKYVRENPGMRESLTEIYEEKYEKKPIDDNDLYHGLSTIAEEKRTTTNGAWEFYLDSWTSIPWCSDEELQAYYG